MEKAISINCFECQNISIFRYLQDGDRENTIDYHSTVFSQSAHCTLCENMVRCLFSTSSFSLCLLDVVFICKQCHK